MIMKTNVCMQPVIVTLGIIRMIDHCIDGVILRAIRYHPRELDVDVIVDVDLLRKEGIMGILPFILEGSPSDLQADMGGALTSLG